MIPEILPVLTSLNKNPENTWIIKKQRRLSSADPVALCPSCTGHESMIVINILFNIFFVSLSIHPESIFCSNISAYFFFFLILTNCFSSIVFLLKSNSLLGITAYLQLLFRCVSQWKAPLVTTLFQRTCNTEHRSVLQRFQSTLTVGRVNWDCSGELQTPTPELQQSAQITLEQHWGVM